MSHPLITIFVCMYCKPRYAHESCPHRENSASASRFEPSHLPNYSKSVHIRALERYTHYRFPFQHIADIGSWTNISGSKSKQIHRHDSAWLIPGLQAIYATNHDLLPYNDKVDCSPVYYRLPVWRRHEIAVYVVTVAYIPRQVRDWNSLTMSQKRR